MASVRSTNTKPEMIVRKTLFSFGYRYRLHCSHLPGKPDIVLPKYHLAIFVHGCFWHHHEDCNKSKYPSTNREFWVKKIESNVARDRKITAELEAMKWCVLIIWECETKKPNWIKRIQPFLLQPNTKIGLGEI